MTDFVTSYSTTGLSAFTAAGYCMRMLLRFGFPLTVVAEGFGLLRGCLRVLSVGRSASSRVELEKALTVQVVPPVLLDQYVNVLKDAMYRVDKGDWYVWSLCVGSLAFRYSRSGGGEVMERRVRESGVGEDVMKVVECINAGGGEEEGVDMIVQALERCEGSAEQ